MRLLLITLTLLFLSACTIQVKNDKKLEADNTILSEYELYIGPKIGKE